MQIYIIIPQNIFIMNTHRFTNIHTRKYAKYATIENPYNKLYMEIVFVDIFGNCRVI